MQPQNQGRTIWILGEIPVFQDAATWEIPFFFFNLERKMEQLMGEQKDHANYKLSGKFLCK